jgi:hypothetical protein
MMHDRLIARASILVVAAVVSSSASGRETRGQATVVVARDPDLATQASQEPPTIGTAAVSGRVVDAITGAPMAGAIVRVTKLGTNAPSTLQSAICDSQGRFVFTKLPENARYVIESDHAGYSRGVYGRQEAKSPEFEAGIPEVSLRPNEWRRDLEIRMWRFANITGRVLDDQGEPLVGVAVRAFVVAPVGGRRYLASIGIASSDDLGSYRLTDLGPGEYLVGIASSQATVLDSTLEVEPRRPLGALFSGGPPDRGSASVSAPTLYLSPGHRVVANSLSVAPSVAGTLSAYAPVFYPDARSPRHGQVIVLPPGTSRSGIDFRLRPVSTFRVSGRASSSVPVQDAPLLRLVPSGAEELGLGNEVATTLLAPDGSFTFLGVPAGDYTLLAIAGGLEFTRVGGSFARLPDPPGISDTATGSGLVAGTNLRFGIRTGAASNVWARQSITVADGDVNEVSLELKHTLHIRGRIEFDGGTALPSALRGVLVNAEPTNRDPALGATSVYVERGTNPTTFSIDGLLPGIYVVGSTSMSVLSVTWHGRDVTDLGVEAIENIDGLVMTLTSKTTEVTGTVTGQVDNKTRAAVLAFPTDSGLWSSYGWTPRRFRSALVQAEGIYTFRNLPAGDYFLIAVEERLGASWTDPTFLRAAATQASRVRVTWGARIGRDLVLRLEPRR